MIEGSIGEWLTRATIWVAMGLWAAAMVWPKRGSVTKWLWTTALVSYLVHIVLAYQHFYEWSHRVAWEVTARDTEAVTGLDSGVGLLINFAFAGILAFDLAGQWRTGQRKGATWINGLILFLILNGAVVFGEGAVRLYGVALITGVLMVLGFRLLSTKGGGPSRS